MIPSQLALFENLFSLGEKTTEESGRLSLKYSPHTEDLHEGSKDRFKLKIELANCYIITGSQLFTRKSRFCSGEMAEYKIRKKFVFKHFDRRGTCFAFTCLVNIYTFATFLKHVRVDCLISLFYESAMHMQLGNVR